jgi:hypothetical protein
MENLRKNSVEKSDLPGTLRARDKRQAMELRIVANHIKIDS